MGPTIIFDKSTLQSLRVDEACWLDAFYLPIITPLFFVETLADLEKYVAKGRTPEQVVGNLADKTPPNACANVHHATVCIAELLGYLVEMDRRPLVGGGKPVVTGDQRGVFFSPSPEMKAMSRWQAGEFREIERDFARGWRRVLSGINFEEIYRRHRCKLGSLDEAKKEADRLMNKDGSRYANLKRAFEALDIKKRERQAILARWKALGGPPLSAFAPYTAYVLTVDSFFNLALGADLISRDRPSNKIDIAYLYYLPFCMIFVSDDKLHERTAKCFLKEDQAFLLGKDLKADLAKLDQHYSRLPEDVKLKGVMSFASEPPHDGFLTTRLWDRFMRKDWRVLEELPMDAKRSAELVKHVNRIVDAAKKQQSAECLGSDDFMVIQKSIPVRMGKWRLVSPEVEKQEFK